MENEPKQLTDGKPAGDDWYKSIQERSGVAPVMLPAGGFIESVQKRKKEELALETLIAELPVANRRYGTSALEQWQGLTPEVEAIVLVAIRLGLDRQRAMAMVGHSRKKLAIWLKMGARGFAPFAGFRQKLLAVEGMAEINAVNEVREAAALELKTAGTYLKLLERRHPVSVDDEEVDDELPFGQFTAEELEAYIASNGQTVPARFITAGGSVDGELIVEDLSAIEVQHLKQEVEMLRRKLEEQTVTGEPATTEKKKARRRKDNGVGNS